MLSPSGDLSLIRGKYIVFDSGDKIKMYGTLSSKVIALHYPDLGAHNAFAELLTKEGASLSNSLT